MQVGPSAHTVCKCRQRTHSCTCVPAPLAGHSAGFRVLTRARCAFRGTHRHSCAFRGTHRHSWTSLGSLPYGFVLVPTACVQGFAECALSKRAVSFDARPASGVVWCLVSSHSPTLLLSYTGHLLFKPMLVRSCLCAGIQSRRPLPLGSLPSRCCLASMHSPQWSWYAVTISPFSTAQDACMTHAAPVLLIRASARMLLLLCALSTDQCRMEARHGLCAFMYVCASVRKLLGGMCALRSEGKLS